ncbi:hypothetical protein [Mucilaginibacter sp. L3T2-6]|uniref:hypothetical protein n=1 Tax=Mucilaginibacter sp. L3T2-6 TaxID=3062491 RepID=UPI00267580B8|nr:hypothetical protein [Mucilaginibacter sp. L3T2-6]MDO3645136.1 hypothetical protein [Mucilaginibacter sp. L3T2-6]MDV6217588.1 hypothetical protein [Mucilaginibacter sp. L3T2-6]
MQLIFNIQNSGRKRDAYSGFGSSGTLEPAGFVAGRTSRKNPTEQAAYLLRGIFAIQHYDKMNVRH